MTDDEGEREAMLGGLLDASHRMSMEELPEEAGHFAQMAGLHNVHIYVVDLQAKTLHLLTSLISSNGDEDLVTPPVLSVDDSKAGEAFQRVSEVADIADHQERQRWWVPLLEGAERLGVVRVDVARVDEHALASMRQFAAMVALLIDTRRRHSDSYARLIRHRPMNVAAELQRSIIPPYTFTNRAVTISAVFEPAYEIAGDAFDYALSGDTVHLAVFDAMGHNVSSGLTACLAVAACRNGRRQGVPLEQLGSAIEQSLIRQFGHSQFVTGVIVEFDTATGRLSWLGHGHFSPVVIRDNEYVELEFAPGHPLGTELELQARLFHAQLEPADRVLLYTDGVIDARTQPEDPNTAFGFDRLLNFVIAHNSTGLAAPEMLRCLMNSITSYHDDRLQDDATIIIMEWHGNPNQAST